MGAELGRKGPTGRESAQDDRRCQAGCMGRGLRGWEGGGGTAAGGWRVRRPMASMPAVVRRIRPASSRSRRAASRAAGGRLVAAARRPWVGLAVDRRRQDRPSLRIEARPGLGAGATTVRGRVRALPGGSPTAAPSRATLPPVTVAPSSSRMSVRLRTRVAPSRMSWLQPAAPGSQGLPGGRARGPGPRLPAARAVERLPESSAASTTTTAADSAAITRLRGRKLAARGQAPGGVLARPGCHRRPAPGPNRPVLARG